jgi:release factor glutamine methyltransferase
MSRRAMTVGTLLRAATAWLTGAGFDEARITAELLLARALATNRAGLYARLGERITPAARAEFERLLGRRANGEPVAYILGEREFYGLPFTVRPGVLVPRPETELLVELALDHARARRMVGPRIVDVGTGSGAVAVVLATELPTARLLAIDLAPEAVEIARENAARHGVADRVEVRVGDLLDGVGGGWDVVVGNLPYIPTATVDSLDRSVRDWEPRLALDGGDDGLSLHARLLEQVRAVLAPGGLLALEIADDRGQAALALMRDRLPEAEVELLRDVFGRDRVVRAIFRSAQERSR